MTPSGPDFTTVSYDLRNYCRDLLLDNVNGFNAVVQGMAPTFGLKPFVLALKGNPATLFLGRYTIASLKRMIGENFGVFCVLSVAASKAMGRNNTRFTPTTFSGSIFVTVEFYTVVNSGTPLPDGEAMWFLLESAMVTVFNSLDPPPKPLGVTYNNEIDGDPGPVEWDGSRMIQAFTFTMAYNKVNYGG